MTRSWIANLIGHDQNHRQYPMAPLNHALNISTLAAWLSIIAIGSIGLVLPERSSGATHKAEKAPLLESLEFALSDLEAIPTIEANPSTPVAAQETPVDPPPLPDLTPHPPLPEIPSPPNHSIPPAGIARSTQPSTRALGPSKEIDRNAQGGSSLSETNRIAAGNMPKPSYPAAARRQKQAGTVVVQFTVNPSGNVIAAYAKSPSPWPLLDAEALRTVQTWTFPQGGMMTRTQPIIFKLD